MTFHESPLGLLAEIFAGRVKAHPALRYNFRNVFSDLRSPPQDIVERFFIDTVTLDVREAITVAFRGSPVIIPPSPKNHRCAAPRSFRSFLRHRQRAVLRQRR